SALVGGRTGQFWKKNLGHLPLVGGGLEDPDTVSAGGFGCVETAVGGAEEGLGVFERLGSGVGGDAGADGDSQGCILDGDGRACDHAANVGGDLLGGGGVGLGEDQGEFVATDSGGQIVLTPGEGKTVADGNEGRVAGGMAVGVVDCFEPV